MFADLLPSNFAQQVASTSVQVMAPFVAPLELVLGVLVAGSLVVIIIRAFTHH